MRPTLLTLTCLLLLACDEPLAPTPEPTPGPSNGLVVDASLTVNAEGYLSGVHVLAANPGPLRFQSVQAANVRTFEPISAGDNVQFQPAAFLLMACPPGHDSAFVVTATEYGHAVTMSAYGVAECVEVFNGSKYRNDQNGG